MYEMVIAQEVEIAFFSLITLLYQPKPWVVFFFKKSTQATRILYGPDGQPGRQHQSNFFKRPSKGSFSLLVKPSLESNTQKKNRKVFCLHFLMRLWRAQTQTFAMRSNTPLASIPLFSTNNPLNTDRDIPAPCFS